MRLSLSALLVGRAGRARAEVEHAGLHDAHAWVRSAAVSVLLRLAACGLGGCAASLPLSNLLLGRRAGLVVVVLGGAVDDLAALLACLAAALAVLGQAAQVGTLLLVKRRSIGRALRVGQARLNASLFARQRGRGVRNGQILVSLNDALNRHRAANLLALALGRTAALQSADVLDALATFVRFLLVAVHLGDGDGLGLTLLAIDEAATSLAALATGVLDACGPGDLAALFEL